MKLIILFIFLSNITGQKYGETKSRFNVTSIISVTLNAIVLDNKIQEAQIIW